MADAKRGRERSGRGKKRQYSLREIEDEVTALREADPTTQHAPCDAAPELFALERSDDDC